MIRFLLSFLCLGVVEATAGELEPSCGEAFATNDDFAILCSDRRAIERVYYHHRTGTKPPFEEVMSPTSLENLVRQDHHKEAVLKNIYGLEITPAMLEAEVRRIDTTTRSPGTLAELKGALNHDPNRFARTVVRPMVVERLLRERYDNDDHLHLNQRREAEQVRRRRLATRSAYARETESSEPVISQSPASAPTPDVTTQRLALLRQDHANKVTETLWQLGPRPKEKPGSANADEKEVIQHFGSNAQIVSALHTNEEKERKLYFEELPGSLLRLLRAQLRQPGDVSAVIEMRSGFVVCLCTEKTEQTLKVATLMLPKRSYDQWLAERKTLP